MFFCLDEHLILKHFDIKNTNIFFLSRVKTQCNISDNVVIKINVLIFFSKVFVFASNCSAVVVLSISSREYAQSESILDGNLPRIHHIKSTRNREEHTQ